ncbi:MAG: hypothetical protein LBF66_00710 [Holosporales bacterium]|nr:hypothetical protein [Holosporales bacterium]
MIFSTVGSGMQNSPKNMHIPSDVPGFLRAQSLVTSGFVPRSVSREPDTREKAPAHFREAPPEPGRYQRLLGG